MTYVDKRPHCNKKPRTKWSSGVQIVLKQAAKQPVTFKDISVLFNVHPTTSGRWMYEAIRTGAVRISSWNKPHRGGQQYPSVVPQDGVAPPEKHPPPKRQEEKRRYYHEQVQRKRRAGL